MKGLTYERLKFCRAELITLEIALELLITLDDSVSPRFDNKVKQLREKIKKYLETEEGE